MKTVRKNTVGLIAIAGVIVALGGVFAYRFLLEMKSVAERRQDPRPPWEREAD